MKGLAGAFNSRLQPIVTLNLGPNAESSVPVPFIVDTGFNQHVAISRSLMVQLEISVTNTVVPGDDPSGECFFDTCEVHVHGGGWSYEGLALVTEIDGMNLLGTRALLGGRIEMEVEAGGRVSLALDS